jgi:hypothetical protein
VSGRGRTPRLLAGALSSLLLALASCTPGQGESAGAQVALHGDSAAAPVAAPAAPTDSAVALDARFQELRAAINRDARALDGAALDRHSRDYAVRFDSLRRRTMAAESLRTRRDALRARAARVAAAAARRDSLRLH